jgi:hypothetical protein
MLEHPLVQLHLAQFLLQGLVPRLNLRDSLAEALVNQDDLLILLVFAR